MNDVTIEELKKRKRELENCKLGLDLSDAVLHLINEAREAKYEHAPNYMVSFRRGAVRYGSSAGSGFGIRVENRPNVFNVTSVEFCTTKEFSECTKLGLTRVGGRVLALVEQFKHFGGNDNTTEKNEVYVDVTNVVYDPVGAKSQELIETRTADIHKVLDVVENAEFNLKELIDPDFLRNNNYSNAEFAGICNEFNNVAHKVDFIEQKNACKPATAHDIIEN